MGNAKKIWDSLKSRGLNDFAVAGIMGNLYAESGLQPNNLQNSYQKSLGFTDESYTKEVDNGSYDNFVKDCAGYGLAQWTFWTRKQALLNYAKAYGSSIGDLTMQLGFLWQELQGYKGIMQVLKTATSVRAASDVILLQYERPRDQSEAVRKKRASYGQKFYNEYAAAPEQVEEGKETGSMREKIVAMAKNWLGRKEADGSHKAIIDVYNAHKPLARGYKVKYTDAWCATFVSAVAIKCGLTNLIPTECGCQKMIELFKALGAWVENDAYTPKAGDIIFYDWQDNGAGDNTGGSDHVGIVEKVSGSAITVIEGNISNAVGRRSLQVNGKYIRGYGVPKYTDSTPVQPEQPAVQDGYKVGDVVEFTGTKHYVSANAASGKNCKAGRAEVTQVYQLGKSKHPYHLKAVSGSTSNVHGWVDAADIDCKVNVKPDAPTQRVHTVKKGDTLSALAKKYDTTVAAILAANKAKYPKITASYIVVGWKLTV